MKGPALQSIRNYDCHTLGLTAFLDQPGDGRTQPEIPAADLSWALLLGGILRLVSANRLEWLANFGHPKDLGLTRKFGDDALAYFTERVEPEVIRHRAAETLKLAKYKKCLKRRPSLDWPSTEPGPATPPRHLARSAIRSGIPTTRSPDTIITSS